MKNKAHNIASYSFAQDEKLLPDANFWCYLYPPNPCPAYGYDVAFKKMLQARALVMLDALVLSEYLNSYCRLEWNALFKATYPNFKTFRKSADFLVVGQAAASFANRILSACQRRDLPFSSHDVSRVLTEFEVGQIDFNDGLITETCRFNGWKLITHDGDCTSGGIEVLTTNSKLLAACP